MWEITCKYGDIFMRWILLVSERHRLEIYLRNQHLKSFRIIKLENKLIPFPQSLLLFTCTKKWGPKLPAYRTGGTEYSGRSWFLLPNTKGDKGKEWEFNHLKTVVFSFSQSQKEPYFVCHHFDIAPGYRDKFELFKSLTYFKYILFDIKELLIKEMF